MTVFIFIFILLYIGGVGFWITGKIDGFLSGGNVHPSWDFLEEKRRKKQEQRQTHCSLKRV